ncbi:hypothetical protein [Helicobacter muridarum]|nr:hypothetical protein [Helicobacter muridarum]
MLHPSFLSFSKALDNEKISIRMGGGGFRFFVSFRITKKVL